MKKLLLPSLLFLLTSCSSFLSRTENFKIHEKKIFENNQSVFKMNGAYISNETGVLFYDNGIFKEFSPQIDSLFWDSSNFKNLTGLKYRYFDDKEAFGCYRVAGDTIYIQDFAIHNQSFYHRWVKEKEIIIINDSTLSVISDYDTYLNHQSITSPIELRFYPLSKKPDSSKVWFLNKNWYKKGLHESRK